MSDVNVHAFLLADRVIREDNGKSAIIGSFNRFHFPAFPATCAPWYVYLNMDNFSVGEHEFVLNMTRRGSGETVYSGGGRFSVDDQAKGVEIGISIPPIRFDRDGVYELSLMIDGRGEGCRILHVDRLAPKEA